MPSYVALFQLVDIVYICKLLQQCTRLQLVRHHVNKRSAMNCLFSSERHTVS